MFKRLLQLLGLAPTKRDLELRERFKDRYKSARISRRGAIHIDPAEVIASPSFQEARQKAKEIVERTK